MPELAETARFAKDLNNIIGSATLKVVRANIGDKFSTKIAPADAVMEVKSNVGHKVKFVSAGKSLFMTLPRINKILNFKLGMSGNFQTKLKAGFEKHVFWTFVFSNGEVVYYVDPRRFGSVSLQRGADEKTREMSLGGFNGNDLVMRELARVHRYMCKKVQLPKTPRIAWLLATGKYTGIGNYMANEALGILDLNPFKPFHNFKEITAVFKACQEVAKESFSKGGYSFGGGYFLLNGEEGSFEGKFYQAIEKQTFRNRPVYSRYKQ